jgi:hypothetical protein
MKKMVNPSLTEYVRAQLQRGYPPEAIRTALLQAGYNPQDIAIALRTSQPAQRKISISGRNILFIIAGLLAVVLLVFAGIILFKPSPKDLQISIDVRQPELLPGSTLSFITTLSSEEKRIVPVSLEYIVSEKFTRKTITSRSSRADVGYSAIDSQSVNLPADIAPGDYEVRLTAKYESLSRISSAGFTVQQPAVEPVEPVAEELQPIEAPIEQEEAGCPASCDDLNPATEDTCEKGSCVHTTKANVCGNGECEAGENRVLCPDDCGASQDKASVIEQAVKQASSNAEKAATMCNSLVLSQDSDPCFAAIAAESKKSALCANIQDIRARDNCLWEFTNLGDFSVCEQLANRYLLTSCLSLSRFSTTSQEMKEGEQQAQEVLQEFG